MTRRRPSPFLLLLCLSACQAAPPAADAPPAAYAPGRVIVGLEPSVAEEAWVARLAEHGITVMRPLIPGRIYLLRLPEGMSVEEAMTHLRRLPGVRYVEPDYLRRPYAPRP